MQAAYAKKREKRAIFVLQSLNARGVNSGKVFLNSLGEPYTVASIVFKDAVDRAKIENFHCHDLLHKDWLPDW